jgi:hypothetical protein
MECAPAPSHLESKRQHENIDFLDIVIQAQLMKLHVSTFDLCILHSA